MKISIAMSPAELESALGACSSMDDNEHDKGVPDDAWQDSILNGAINALNAAIARNDGALIIGIAEFGLLCDAVEIYCTDPADDEEPNYTNDIALAERLIALFDHTIAV